eukprot:7241321-Karenia_brevis.AAC.1
MDSSSSVHRVRRPNRTAAQRRAQQNRAMVRITGRLLKLQQSMDHRGASSTKVFQSTSSQHIASFPLVASAPPADHGLFSQSSSSSHMPL